MSSIMVPPAPKAIAGPNGASVTTPMQISRPERVRAICCTVMPLMRASGRKARTRSIMSL